MGDLRLLSIPIVENANMPVLFLSFLYVFTLSGYLIETFIPFPINMVDPIFILLPPILNLSYYHYSFDVEFLKDIIFCCKFRRKVFQRFYFFIIHFEETFIHFCSFI